MKNRGSTRVLDAIFKAICTRQSKARRREPASLLSGRGCHAKSQTRSALGCSSRRQVVPRARRQRGVRSREPFFHRARRGKRKRRDGHAGRNEEFREISVCRRGRRAAGVAAKCLGGRLMEHRGVAYRIIQGIKPGDWKWSVLSDTAGPKSGTSDIKDAAVSAAKRAIDNALDPKKRKLSPPA